MWKFEVKIDQLFLFSCILLQWTSTKCLFLTICPDNNANYDGYDFFLYFLSLRMRNGYLKECWFAGSCLSVRAFSSISSERNLNHTSEWLLFIFQVHRFIAAFILPIYDDTFFSLFLFCIVASVSSWKSSFSRGWSVEEDASQRTMGTCWAWASCGKLCTNSTCYLQLNSPHPGLCCKTIPSEL